jgi:hypothetical protein
MHTHRILLVADRTAADPHVCLAIRTRAAEAPIAVTLLVPATRPRGGWTWDEATALGEARQRMRTATANLRRAGITVTAVLGDHSPLEAIRDEMRRRAYDEIVVSTLPARASRWLRADLLTRVAREFPLPLVHVEAGAAPVDVSRAFARRPAA